MTGPKGGGLRGRDKQQSRLRDLRQGAHDSVGNQSKADTSQATRHEKAQAGSAMQGEPVPSESVDLPVGLKRPRAGPYDKDKGRSDD